MEEKQLMKFNLHLPIWRQEFLEKQYKEYIKTTPMTKKEQRALREWVKNGNSVYENPSEAWSDGQVPVEFLTVYRDEEYIRQHTKDMDPEEARRFALAYYGWDDEPVEYDISGASEAPDWLREMAIPEELPFN